MITMMRQKQIFRQVEGIKMADRTVPDDELRPEYDETSLKNGIMQSNTLLVQILPVLNQTLLLPFLTRKLSGLGRKVS